MESRTKSWKAFPSNYLEERLKEIPVDLFETGKKDPDDLKRERLANYPDYPETEDEED